jgi:hypothetical protein
MAFPLNMAGPPASLRPPHLQSHFDLFQQVLNLEFSKTIALSYHDSLDMEVMEVGSGYELPTQWVRRGGKIVSFIGETRIRE